MYGSAHLIVLSFLSLSRGVLSCIFAGFQLIRKNFTIFFQSGKSGKTGVFRHNQEFFQPTKIVFANHVFLSLGRVRLSGFLSMSGAGLSCISSPILEMLRNGPMVRPYCCQTGVHLGLIQNWDCTGG